MLPAIRGFPVANPGGAERECGVVWSFGAAEGAPFIALRGGGRRGLTGRCRGEDAGQGGDDERRVDDVEAGRRWTTDFHARG